MKGVLIRNNPGAITLEWNGGKEVLPTIKEAFERSDQIKSDPDGFGRDWLIRFSMPIRAYTGCIYCGKYTDHGGVPCPDMAGIAYQANQLPAGPGLTEEDELCA